jgi:hypothetical protein
MSWLEGFRQDVQAVAFTLKAGNYVVQVSGSDKPDASVLVTAER